MAKRRSKLVGLLVTTALMVALAPGRAAAASCDSLSALVMADTTIVSAGVVAAGPFTPPGTATAAPAPLNVPAFCRVVGRVAPAINFEVWMPAANWNGKFQGVGGGGYVGSISYGAMAAALRQGYATASTDTGHSGGDGAWALGRPDLVVDFAHRAIHETTVRAKAIIRAFHDRDARWSYFVGCSQGGRQGYMEAQRYPADYDGIVAGAPAHPWTRLMVSELWVGTAALKEPASQIPPGKYPTIHKAALAACDRLDGVVDGLIENPQRCRFDPAALLCKGPDADTCLTAAQVDAVKKIYAPARNPRSGEKLFAGLPPGSELGWPALAGSAPGRLPTEFFKHFVFNDPDWDWRTFDFDKDVARTDAKLGAILDGAGSDLRAFRARGGKIIAYHGWNDQLVAAESSIDYYDQAARTAGGKPPDDFYRLFMAPGVNHCRGGSGPDTFDAVAAIEGWVERGVAPDRIVASHLTNGIVDRTRPLCPYPQVAKYTGSGSSDDAANFVCTVEDGESAGANGNRRQ